jgi:hypothetical protein
MPDWNPKVIAAQLMQMLNEDELIQFKYLINRNREELLNSLTADEQEQYIDREFREFMSADPRGRPRPKTCAMCGSSLSTH